MKDEKVPALKKLYKRLTCFAIPTSKFIYEIYLLSCRCININFGKKRQEKYSPPPPSAAEDYISLIILNLFCNYLVIPG